MKNADPDGNIPLDTILDAGFVLYDIGKIGVGYFTGNAALMQEGTIDFVSDSLSLVTPYVPAGGSRMARAMADGASDVTNSAPKYARNKYKSLTPKNKKV